MELDLFREGFDPGVAGATLELDYPICRVCFQLISDEGNALFTVADVRFLFCNGKLEVDFDELSNLLPDLFGVCTRANDPESGKEAALRRLPPLETGRAPLSAPSLSPSRTTRFLVLCLL